MTKEEQFKTSSHCCYSYLTGKEQDPQKHNVPPPLLILQSYVHRELKCVQSYACKAIIKH